MKKEHQHLRHDKPKQNHPRTDGGFALLLVVFFFLAFFTAVVIGFSGVLGSRAQNTRENMDSDQAFYTAQSGMEDALYRLDHSDIPDQDTEVLSLNGTVATTTVQSISATEVGLLSSALAGDAVRKVSADGTVGAGTSFGSGAQAGEGGIYIKGGATITGNVYSNGLVTGGGYRLSISGDVVSAGPEGSVSHVDAGGNVYAHSIDNSNISGDAFYSQNLTNVLVYGAKHPDSPDQPLATMPISDATIDGWEQEAESGSVYNGPCPYSPTSTTTIGNIKINCNVSLAGSAVLVLTGPVWVNGNISVGGGGEIKVDPSLGTASVPIIADDTSNPGSDGTINASGGAKIYGSGTEGSYVIFVSQNQSGEDGGSVNAINISGGALGGVVLYAPHGNISLSGGVSVHEITGYSIVMSGGADLVYEDGLKSITFPGAQGSWGISSWKEVE
ncbi:MAG TPA: hypothetical protein VFM02_02240 [Candidatus Paceibacterota bacterium]|nr:hypothetical protein [Candidatus Paceibacterota bacterium]